MNRTQLISNVYAIPLQLRNPLRRSLDGELSHVGNDDDDESLDDEAYFRVAEAESRELAVLDAALERIREGRYGVCDECGDKIAVARLQVLPCATLCIKCQQQTEGPGRHSLRRSRASHAGVFA